MGLVVSLAFQFSYYLLYHLYHFEYKIMWVNMLDLLREAADSQWVDGVYILYIRILYTQQLHLLSLLQAKNNPTELEILSFS